MEEVNGCEVFYKRRTATHIDMGVVGHGVVLKHLTLPVNIGISFSLLEIGRMTVFLNDVQRQHFAPRLRFQTKLLLSGLVADGQGIGTAERARQLTGELQGSIHAHLNLRMTFLTTLGGNKDNTISTTHTIDCCSRGILQDGDALYRRDVDAVHWTLNTIDEDERVAVVPRAHATNDNLRVFLAGHTGGTHRHNTRHITRQGSTNTGYTARTLKRLASGLGDGTHHTGLLLLAITDNDDFIKQSFVVLHRNIHITGMAYFYFLALHSYIREYKHRVFVGHTHDKVTVKISDCSHAGFALHHDGCADDRLAGCSNNLSLDSDSALGHHVQAKDQ